MEILIVKEKNQLVLHHSSSKGSLRVGLHPLKCPTWGNANPKERCDLRNPLKKCVLESKAWVLLSACSEVTTDRVAGGQVTSEAGSRT